VGDSLMPTNVTRPRLRSQLWFDNPDNPGMTALYLIERYLNRRKADHRHRSKRLRSIAL
jgi:dihydroxy-acid dehydratase